MRRYGLTYRPADGEALIAAVPTFGPFPDVPPALAKLAEHSRLVIISNTEDDLIAENVRRIGVPFQRVITAEQARAYKPSHAIFAYTLRELDCAPSDILHVAQGFLYDVVPTHELGWKCVWINRHGQPGDGVHRPWRALPDLTGLPALLEIG
jgi:2-haloacid dehalogenase